MSESKTPITDLCENTDGSIKGNDELIETCRRFEAELQAAKSTASKAMHDYEMAVMEIAEWRTVFGDIADASAKWDEMNLKISELCGTDNYLLAVDLEKAKEEITKLKREKTLEELCSNSWRKMAMELLDEIAKLRKENEWHLASEKPEYGKRYIYIEEHGTMFMERYWGTLNKFVTHWRELPKLPGAKQ